MARAMDKLQAESGDFEFQDLRRQRGTPPREVIPEADQIRDQEVFKNTNKRDASQLFETPLREEPVASEPAPVEVTPAVAETLEFAAVLPGEPEDISDEELPVATEDVDLDPTGS